MRANICKTEKHLLSEIQRANNMILWYSGDEFKYNKTTIKPNMFYIARGGVIRHVVDSKIFESLENSVVRYEFGVGSLRKDDWGSFVSEIYDYYIQRESDLRKSKDAIHYNSASGSLTINKNLFLNGVDGYKLVIEGKPRFDVSY